MPYNNKSIDRKALLRIIKRDGWALVRQKGGHLQFKHPTKKGKVTIPFKVSKNIEKSVLKQAQIKERN